jgi:glucose-6-phosphate 1-dehydrogenase
MCHHRHLDVPVVAVALEGWSLERLQARARESIAHHGQFDEEPPARLLQPMRYVDGDYNDDATCERLRRELGRAARPRFRNGPLRRPGPSLC